MPDETKPTKKDLKDAMSVFFGPHGGDGIGLDEPETPTGAPTPPAEPPKPKEGEPELNADGTPKVKDGEPTPPPAAPPAAPPKKVKKVAPASTAMPPPPKTDDETISRVASETAARTVAAMAKTQEPAPGDVQLEGLDLDEEDKERIAEMQLAGRVNPKFAGLAERTLKFWKLEKDYIEEWKKANPDKDYDVAEHKKFYSDHEPDYEQGEFKKTVKQAERDALKAEVKGEVSLESKAEVSKLRFETRWKEEAPEIDQVANDTVAKMITELDPELAKMLQVDHEAVVSTETLAKLAEADPVAGRVITRQAGYLARMIREVERLDRYPEFYRGDAANPLHVNIFNAALDLEEHIALLPAEDQLFDAENDDKRTFIRQSDFIKRLDEVDREKTSPTEKDRARKALEEKYWTLDAADVKAAVVDKVRKHTAEKIAEDREVVAAALKKSGSTAPPTTPTPTPTPTPAPATARPKPPSTAVGGGERTSTQTPAPPSSGNKQEVVDAAFFR